MQLEFLDSDLSNSGESRNNKSMKGERHKFVVERRGREGYGTPFWTGKEVWKASIRSRLDSPM